MIANHFAAKQPFCSLHPPKDGPGAAGISMVTAQAPAGCWGAPGLPGPPEPGRTPKEHEGRWGWFPSHRAHPQPQHPARLSTSPEVPLALVVALVPAGGHHSSTALPVADHGQGPPVHPRALQESCSLIYTYF